MLRHLSLKRVGARIPWIRPDTFFFQFEIIANVLISFFALFEYLCYGAIAR